MTYGHAIGDALIALKEMQLLTDSRHFNPIIWFSRRRPSLHALFGRTGPLRSVSLALLVIKKI